MECGMRDPVVAYEYYNRFYIVEGNKRVSVMRRLDAVTIEGHVTRIMPEPEDSERYRIYQEFLGFFADSGLNTFLFKTEGSLPASCRILLSDCYLDRLNFMKNSRPSEYDESIHTLYHTLAPTESGVWEINWKNGMITLSVNGSETASVPMTASEGLNHAAVLFYDKGELKITHFEAQIDGNRWDTGIELS
jgi:hypothetical protein